MSAGVGSEPLLRLRPLGLGEILDEIFRVYRRHFGLLWAVSLVLAVPSFLVQVATGSVGGVGSLNAIARTLGPAGNPGQATLAAAPNLALFGLAYLVVLAALPYTTGTVCRVGIDLALGSPVGVGSALARTARRYWALMGLVLLLVLLALVLFVGLVLGLVGLGLLLGLLGLGRLLGLVAAPLFLLCFLVAIWLLVRWSVTVPALLAEGIGPIRALGRSWTLTRRSWWRAFGILLLIFLLQAAISVALALLVLPIGIAIPFLSSFLGGAITAAISTGVSAVVAPVISLCLVLLYFDLRIRRESFDLDQMARQTVGWPPPPA